MFYCTKLSTKTQQVSHNLECITHMHQHNCSIFLWKSRFYYLCVCVWIIMKLILYFCACAWTVLLWPICMLSVLIKMSFLFLGPTYMAEMFIIANVGLSRTSRISSFRGHPNLCIWIVSDIMQFICPFFFFFHFPAPLIPSWSNCPN